MIESCEIVVKEKAVRLDNESLILSAGTFSLILGLGFGAERRLFRTQLRRALDCKSKGSQVERRVDELDQLVHHE